MSEVDFSKFPPPAKAAPSEPPALDEFCEPKPDLPPPQRKYGRRRTSEAPGAPEPTYAVGDWVQCKATEAFGQITRVDGAELLVTWANGVESCESAESVTESAPTMYHNKLLTFAERELGIERDQAWQLHYRVAPGGVTMSLQELSRFEDLLLSMWTVEPAADDFADLFATSEDGTEEAPADRPNPHAPSAGEPPATTGAADQAGTDPAGGTASSAPLDGSSSTASAGPLRTEAGLIDPETGLVVEESLILRKFGWIEWPRLPDEPTAADLEAFEAKLDQVVDVLLSYRERTARWRAATELRCKGLDAAADYYESQLVAPLARQLAPHRLPRYKSGAKKGEFRTKTLPLASGAVSFVATGGYYVHDAEQVKRHIEETGLESFGVIDAKLAVSYSHRKLLSALKAGKLKNLPGTGYNRTDPFGSVRVKSPAAAGDDAGEDSNGG